MSFFLTGSNGFVGSALFRVLQKNGEVIGTVRRHPQEKSQIIHDWMTPFTPRGTRTRIFVHAAFAGNGNERSNEEMARNAMKAACEMKAERVFVLSTGSVYREQKKALTELSPLDRNTQNAHGISSQRVEQIFTTNPQEIPVCLLRLFYPYGPGQSISRLIPRMASQIREKGRLTLKGQGEGPRINPIYLTDLSTLLCEIVLSRRICPVLNISGNEILSIKNLALLVAKSLGLGVQFDSDRGELSHCCDRFADSSRAYEETEFTPKVGLSEGLKLTLREPCAKLSA